MAVVSKTLAAVDTSTIKADQAVRNDNGTTTLPAFMERMLLCYAVADYYRSENQNEKAFAEEQRGEEYFNQELERFERIQSQNKITIRNYPNYYSNLLVHQTVI